MYVADITDINELHELLDETNMFLLRDPHCEQLRWDKEDILNRLDELNDN